MEYQEPYLTTLYLDNLIKVTYFGTKKINKEIKDNLEKYVMEELPLYHKDLTLKKMHHYFEDNFSDEWSNIFWKISNCTITHDGRAVVEVVSTKKERFELEFSQVEGSILFKS